MDSSAAPDPESPATAARLRDLIMGFRVTQMLHVAARLNLADQLARGPQSPERVAEKVGADPAALRRFMRALTSLGILTEERGAFGLTAIGQLLRRDLPDSHTMISFFGVRGPGSASPASRRRTRPTSSRS